MHKTRTIASPTEKSPFTDNLRSQNIFEIVAAAGTVYTVAMNKSLKRSLLAAVLVPLLALTAMAQPRSRSAHPQGRRLPAKPLFGRAITMTPVRSEGLGFKQEAPSAPSRVHSVDGGDKIVYDPSRGTALTNHMGVFQAHKYTLPPPNPGTTAGGRATGNNAITPNTTPPGN